MRRFTISFHDRFSCGSFVMCDRAKVTRMHPKVRVWLILRPRWASARFCHRITASLPRPQISFGPPVIQSLLES